MFMSELNEHALQLQEALGRIEALQHTISLQQMLLDSIPALVFLKDRQHRYQIANRTFAERTLTPDDVIGKSDHELFPPDIAAAYLADDEQVMVSGVANLNVELPITRLDGGAGWVANTGLPYRDNTGTVVGMVGLAFDITDRRRAEEELKAREDEQQDLIEQQRRLLETIRELSTPVLPVFPGTLILPLVGHIDSLRSQQIMEALLLGIQQHQASLVIIDITGVPMVDTAVANYLIQATRAARLLGSQCVLVGISPEIAQTLVSLGVDLSDLASHGSLQAAIRLALKRTTRTL
jgi:rsbT co-antagonist protein RsbR